MTDWILMNLTNLTAALSKIKDAGRVAVLTGAGISAESGVPTFRGTGGYWKNYKAEELATPEAFQANPELVWEWDSMRREVCAKANPNSGHKVIAEMESRYKEFLLITQNVDGLHRRAGSNKMQEIHGCINDARCTFCNQVFPLPPIELTPKLPACPDCGSLARPHIVWFGESYFPGMLEDCNEFTKFADLIFIIGTSGMISAPMNIALAAIRRGAYSIEINPERSTITPNVSLYIQESAGKALTEIWKHLN